ncbi:uncharacterized protein LOC120943017 isoform X2 [Rana temporaria]|uniref:uncharacterized protein LOC120943017 isoform X2 n=1 Tax=Rana temporaria TaxID=8407 RepID=UPI001AAC5DA4|nr:uncharacterized protein LOC120943017 isoform X2 [Rana temporaria]
MTKELMISNHLAKMDETRLIKFKKALCQMKPPPGAGPIKMEDLKDKSIEEIVEFIFRCHTERHGPATIKNVLIEISENQIRMLIDRDLRNGAFKSKSIEDEQSGKQESNLHGKTFVPAHVAIQCPEPPAKKIKREQVEDAVIGISSQNIKREKEEDALIRAPNHKIQVEKEDDVVIGVPNHKIKIETEDVAIGVPNHKIKGEEDAMKEVPNHKETTSRKDEGHRPVHRPPKQEPQPQVNPEQDNITSNLFHTALKKQFAGAASHGSSTKPQPQIHPEQGDTKGNIFHKTTNKQLGVDPSQASSKASTSAAVSVHLMEPTALADHYQQTSPIRPKDASPWRRERSRHASSKRSRRSRSRSSSRYHRSRHSRSRRSRSHHRRSHRRRSPSLHREHYNTRPAANACWVCSATALPGKLACRTRFNEATREKEADARVATDLIRELVRESICTAAPLACDDPTPGTSSASGPYAQPAETHSDHEERELVSRFDFGLVEPFSRSVKEAIGWEEPVAEPLKVGKYFPELRREPFIEELEDLIKEEWEKPDKRPGLSNKLAKLYPLKESKVSSLINAPIVDSSLMRLARHVTLPIEDAVSFRDVLDHKIDLELKKAYSTAGGACRPAIATAAVARGNSTWAANTEKALLEEQQPQTTPEQGNLTSNLFHKTPKKRIGVSSSHSSSKGPQPQVNLEQGKITRNTIDTAPNKSPEVNLSHASSKEAQRQVNPGKGKTTSNEYYRIPFKRFEESPSHASSKTGPQPQVNLEQGKITRNTIDTAPNKSPEVTLSHASSKEAQRQVNPGKGKTTSNEYYRIPFKRFEESPSHASSKTGPQPQVNLEQGKITRNTIDTAPNKSPEVNLSHASSKGTQPRVSRVQGNFTRNMPNRTPSNQYGGALSHSSYKEPQRQVNPEKGKTTSNEYRIPLKSPSHASFKSKSWSTIHHYTSHPEERQPQVNPGQSKTTSNISPRAPSNQYGVASHSSSNKPRPQVSPKHSTITSNSSHRAPNKQFGLAPPYASSKGTQPRVSRVQGNFTRNVPNRTPSNQYGGALSHTPYKGKSWLCLLVLASWNATAPVQDQK